MNNMMPDSISSMGRAVQAKTANMTPDQVAELDRQYANMGLMSINDVITLKQQLDHMKQSAQPAQMPQTTVVQDLQQQATGGGLPSLSSNVGKEQAYSRGGIVAFPQGGLVDFDPMAAQRGLASLAGAEAPVGSGVMAGAASGADDAAAVAARIAQAEAAASTAAPAVRKTIISRLLGGAGAAAKFPIKHPLVFAALTAAPLVYSWLSGDDEEEAQPAAAAGAPPEQPPMDLSALLGQARAEGMGGGVSMKGGIGGIPDVNGQFAGLIGEAQKSADTVKPQTRDEMTKMMEDRYSGLTGHIDKRGEEIAANEAKLNKDKGNDFWEAVAKGGFSMAKAAGESGATFGGSAAEGALAGMEDYRALTDKYKAEKDKLDEQRFAMGEAQAAHKRGIIASTDAEDRHREEIYNTRVDRVLALQTARVNALLEAQNQSLNRQAQLAIRMAGEKGLTGLELLTHAAAIAGVKGGKDSPEFIQLNGLISEIVGNMPQVQSAEIRAQQGFDPMMGGSNEGFRVVGSRPAQ